MLWLSGSPSSGGSAEKTANGIDIKSTLMIKIILEYFFIIINMFIILINYYILIMKFNIIIIT